MSSCGPTGTICQGRARLLLVHLTGHWKHARSTLGSVTAALTFCFVRRCAWKCNWSRMLRCCTARHFRRTFLSHPHAACLSTCLVNAENENGIPAPAGANPFDTLLSSYLHAQTAACTHGIAGKGTRRRAARGHRTWHLEVLQFSTGTI